MKIYVPYFPGIREATRVALIGYPYIPAEAAGLYGYQEFFRGRWAAGESFIVVEHDVVPWPGSLEGLRDCPEPWCAHNFHLHLHRRYKLTDPGATPPLGCAKITAAFIEATPGLFDEPCGWEYCDQRVRDNGVFAVHEHFPGVVNANAVLLGHKFHDEWPG